MWTCIMHAVVFGPTSDRHSCFGEGLCPLRDTRRIISVLVSRFVGRDIVTGNSLYVCARVPKAYLPQRTTRCETQNTPALSYEHQFSPVFHSNLLTSALPPSITTSLLLLVMVFPPS